MKDILSISRNVIGSFIILIYALKLEHRSTISTCFFFNSHAISGIVQSAVSNEVGWQVYGIRILGCIWNIDTLITLKMAESSTAIIT